MAAVNVDRDQIRIVGSSTVYPFSSYVAEEFGTTTRYPTPVVESTGSGGGHKLFGAGYGPDTPDITNSSRKMKASEFEIAQKNNVGKITEAVIGYDGIAVAQNIRNGAANFTLEQLALAVAKDVPDPNGGGSLVPNPYKRWNQIDRSLPDREIKIYGPPTTSGTRDAFAELVLEVATKKMPAYGGEAYMQVRQDGPWIDAGENDNLIVQKLSQDRDAFGVFGYSFLDENRDKVAGATINGIAPTAETISTGEYPVSRSLFFYVKQAHLSETPGLREYIDLFMSEKMIGPDGQLKKIGLVPLPEHLRKASRQRVKSMDPMTLTDGKLDTLEDYAAKNGFKK
jgi:phosphate transport system substrate-binding protein